jgi:hypothetical protein
MVLRHGNELPGAGELFRATHFRRDNMQRSRSSITTDYLTSLAETAGLANGG